MKARLQHKVQTAQGQHEPPPHNVHAVISEAQPSDDVNQEVAQQVDGYDKIPKANDAGKIEKVFTHPLYYISLHCLYFLPFHVNLLPGIICAYLLSYTVKSIQPVITNEGCKGLQGDVKGSVFFGKCCRFWVNSTYQVLKITSRVVQILDGVFRPSEM
jgi:hypothetical protein